MRVVSINVGEVRLIHWQGRDIRTGFRKRPVNGRTRIRGAALAGDQQADLVAHGGPQSAVYVYPSEHYSFWREALELRNLHWGAFGENLTSVGWLEWDAHIGDIVQIGSARLQITHPRTPCYKMNAIFGRNDMIEIFHRSGRSGFYLAPVQEGDMGAGDEIDLISRIEGAPSVIELLQMETMSESRPPVVVGRYHYL
jgi:MOSC domain-containing protein YiiM